MSLFDVEKIREDFPILHQKINGYPLIYLDNGATTQKPNVVLDAILKYYQKDNSNVHRGVHTLSQVASGYFEEARQKISDYFGLTDEYTLIFTYGTTDSNNTVAYGMLPLLQDGDEILISELEHHSNIVPWHLISFIKKIKINYIPCNTDGSLDTSNIESLLTPKTKLISISHLSNVLGTMTPLEEILPLAKAKNIPIMIDGAQSASHLSTNVPSLGADFFSFSGHKMYGPTGIGGLILKKKWIPLLAPFRGGGGMIQSVEMSHTTYADNFLKFEAGTPNIAGAIGLGVAVEYLQKIGLPNIIEHEKKLTNYALEQIKQIPGVQIFGGEGIRKAVISFSIEGVHSYDLGALLDKMGIAVRTGRHCTEPLMNVCKVSGMMRVSFALYNTMEEVDSLILNMNKAIKMLS